VVRGAPTALGPNSMVAVNHEEEPLTQAVWQAKSFTAVFGSENLRGYGPKRVLDAMYARVP